MKSLNLTLLALAWCMCLTACQNDRSGGLRSDAASSNKAAQPPRQDQIEQPGHDPLPRISQDQYQGLALHVTSRSLMTHPEQHTVTFEVTAPTGGWMIQIDEGRVVNEVAKIFLTFERPADDEIVTQALVNHKTNFTTQHSFKAVEAYVHLAKRGEPTLTTDYRLAHSSIVR